MQVNGVNGVTAEIVDDMTSTSHVGDDNVLKLCGGTAIEGMSETLRYHLLIKYDKSNINQPTM